MHEMEEVIVRIGNQCNGAQSFNQRFDEFETHGIEVWTGAGYCSQYDGHQNLIRICIPALAFEVLVGKQGEPEYYRQLKDQIKAQDATGLREAVYGHFLRLVADKPELLMERVTGALENARSEGMKDGRNQIRAEYNKLMETLTRLE